MIKTHVKKLKTSFMNLSIKNKLIIANYIIISLIAFSIGITAYFLYSQTITTQLSEANLRDLKQVGNSIDFLQRDITELSNFIGSDYTVQKTISYSPNELSTATQDQSYVKYLVNNLLISKEYVSFISIIAGNGFSHYAASDRSFNIPTFKEIQNTDAYREAYALKGSPLWAYVPISNTDYIINNQGDKVSMFRTLLKLNDYSTKGFIMISINIQKLEEVYKSMLEINQSVIILLDENNEPTFFDTKLPSEININDLMDNIPEYSLNIGEGTKLFRYNGKKHLLTFVSLNNVNWKLINIVPLQNFAVNVNFIPIIVIIVLIFALLLGFYFTTFTSSMLIKPINNLLESMNRVKKGNFKEMVNAKYNDEVGDLCRHYNEMIANINKLLNQVYTLEIEEKIAELKALQAQINPHFLYNTLDTIYWKAVSGDNKGVQEMIHALSKLFRLALNVGKDFLNVRQERELISFYLLLQEKRYKNKLNYNLDFKSNILYCQIPKLILQPFVENAIVHGIETEDKPTDVEIIGYKEGERLHFIIRDNGTGMSPEVLDKLLDSKINEDNTPEKGGYGIKNVINRLSIYYGNDYSIDIKSRLGEGTEINIILPTTPNIYLEKGNFKGYV
jgi:two-component system sensor histidine kinase YesM